MGIAEVLKEQGERIEALDKKISEFEEKIGELPSKDDISRMIDEYVTKTIANRALASQLKTIEKDLLKAVWSRELGGLGEREVTHIMRILRGDVSYVLPTAEKLEDLSLIEKGRKDWDRIE